MADEDFEEGEVLWALVKERNDHESFSCRGKKGHSFLSSSSSSSSSSTASKLIPRSINGSHEDNISRRNNRQSAPLHIPDWSKVYRSTSNGDLHHHHGESEELDDDDDESCEKVPPHEWIAKKLARSQISSFSVCEGEGRTLKGRDQRKVRNAVLTRTGFLE